MMRKNTTDCLSELLLLFFLFKRETCVAQGDKKAEEKVYKTFQKIINNHQEVIVELNQMTRVVFTAL